MSGKELSSFAVMEADTKMLVNKNKKLWTLRKCVKTTDLIYRFELTNSHSQNQRQ